ncbi:hypothetical protein FRB99_002238 [Tulasnella sp. 403]|nr:hypothetical protein FRB99_002238 [Tulasnella sp. 403]
MLLRIYSDKLEGTVQAASEYVEDDTDDDERQTTQQVYRPPPVYTGVPAVAMVAVVMQNKCDNETMLSVEEGEGMPGKRPDGKGKTKGTQARAPEDVTPDKDIPKVPDIEPTREHKKLGTIPVPQLEGKGTPTSVVQTAGDEQPTSKPSTATVGNGKMTESVPTDVPKSQKVDEKVTIDKEAMESTALEWANEVGNGEDVMKIIKESYVTNAFFDMVMANPMQYQNFEMKDGMLYLNEDGESVLK